MNTTIRFARIEDTKEILSIYAPYVLHDSATFEYEVPSIEEFEKRIQTIQKSYPYLVYEENNEILGYAYASRYKERKAYEWDVEVSVYVRKDSLGKGIGKKLYACLFTILKKQNICNVYACITGENIGSIKMHEKLGFEHAALFKRSGYKFHRWLDVVWMEKSLQLVEEPREIIRIKDVIPSEFQGLEIFKE